MVSDRSWAAGMIWKEQHNAGRVCLYWLWWELLDFPWLSAALEDLADKGWGNCLKSCISSDSAVQIQ